MCMRLFNTFYTFFFIIFALHTTLREFKYKPNEKHTQMVTPFLPLRFYPSSFFESRLHSLPKENMRKKYAEEKCKKRITMLRKIFALGISFYFRKKNFITICI